MNLLQMDMNLLKVLYVLLETSSTGKTAQKLALSPSAVSHALMRLRDALNDPLFRREGNRQIPTPYAQALRAAVDLKTLGEFTITLDCDVIQADGGTRTASITGACVALADALNKLVANGKLKTNPMKGMVAAVSVGIVNGEAICDLEYVEDSAAETDMNVVMTEDGRIIEVQGTAEGEPFSHEELLTLLALARGGIESIVATQKAALEN